MYEFWEKLFLIWTLYFQLQSLSSWGICKSKNCSGFCSDFPFPLTVAVYQSIGNLQFHLWSSFLPSFVLVQFYVVSHLIGNMQFHLWSKIFAQSCPGLVLCGFPFHWEFAASFLVNFLLSFALVQFNEVSHFIGNLQFDLRFNFLTNFGCIFQVFWKND